MKIGILGYGKEGQSAETYFQQHGHGTQVFDHFTTADLDTLDLADFDLVLRSPSVHPRPGFSSLTRYFFDHCPCPIIGVTGTKGKGTTCSILTELLQHLGRSAYLVGNIGTPAIDILDRLRPDDAVVYELSSFQLWDLAKSPHIAIVLGIEADHLNVHDDYDDYVDAKANIARHQTATDTTIYYSPNPGSAKIAATSPGRRIAYPLADRPAGLDDLLARLAIPGPHNRDNAEAALLAAASFLELPLADFLERYRDAIIETFTHFRGLPHRLEFLRELSGVRYYDDNFSTTPTSLAVALASFPDQPIVLIAGGRDKTANADLPEIVELITTHPNLIQTILIGESGHELAKLLDHSVLAETLPDAITRARAIAERHADATTHPIVLMSPAAASFDMFENVYARGAEFQKLIRELS